MSARAAARHQSNDVADEAGLAIDVTNVELADDGLAEAVTLPDGKRIFPTKIGGVPIHKIAAALLDMQDPAASRFSDRARPTAWSEATRIARIAALVATTPLAEKADLPFIASSPLEQFTIGRST